VNTRIGEVSETFFEVKNVPKPKEKKDSETKDKDTTKPKAKDGSKLPEDFMKDMNFGAKSEG